MIRSLFLLLLLPSLVLAEPKDLSQLLHQLEQQLQQQNQQQQQRVEDFGLRRDQLAQRVAQLQQQLTAAQQTQQHLQTLYQDNQRQLQTKQQRLSSQQGDLHQVYSAARQHAQQLQNDLNHSQLAPLFTDHGTALLEISQNQTALSPQQLNQLWLSYSQAMIYSGQINRYTAPLYSPQGQPLDQQPLTAVGPFATLSSAGYVNYLPELDRLQVFSQQPRQQQQGIDFNQQDSGVHPVALDPLTGEGLRLLQQTPTLSQRLQQGGGIGYLILGLGALGLLLTLWRLTALLHSQWQIQRQHSTTANTTTPLGRVRLAIAQAKSETQRQELLDSALAHEAARLQHGHGWVKLLAAVTPMLGLLGTVTGMILTFQAITLHGNSDPTLMATGISQALITTVMGLSMAIPLLFCHSLLSALSKRVFFLLDDYATQAPNDHA